MVDKLGFNCWDFYRLTGFAQNNFFFWIPGPLFGIPTRPDEVYWGLNVCKKHFSLVVSPLFSISTVMSQLHSPSPSTLITLSPFSRRHRHDVDLPLYYFFTKCLSLCVLLTICSTSFLRPFLFFQRIYSFYTLRT